MGRVGVVRRSICFFANLQPVPFLLYRAKSIIPVYGRIHPKENRGAGRVRLAAGRIYSAILRITLCGRRAYRRLSLRKRFPYVPYTETDGPATKHVFPCLFADARLAIYSF